MTNTPKPSKPEDRTESPANISHGHPVPGPDGVDQHNEDPRDRAIRLGQGDVVNPGVPTGQNPEQMRAELIEHDSNEQLRIAGEKRAEAEQRDPGSVDGRDQRGFVDRG